MSNPTLEKTYKVSGAAIAANKIVYGDTTNTTNNEVVVLSATASTQRPIGVTAESTSAADKPARIVISGIAKVNVDGSGTAIDIGDQIIATTAGQGIKAAAVGATAQEVLGIALAPSAAAGDLIDVLIDRQSLVKGTV